MKNYYFTLLTLLTFSSVLLHGQQTPINFDESNHVFIVFNENTNINPPNKFDIFNNAQDSSDKVGRFFVDGPNPNDSQGFYIDLSNVINLDTNKIITLDFFKYDGDAHVVTVKLEQGGANPDVEVSVNVSGAPGSWSNDLQFDFSNAKRVSDNSIINATGDYSRLTLFIDKGVANKPPGTFHVDDINDGSVVSNPNVIDIEYTELVWADEFDTPGAVNTSKWHHQTQVIIPGVGWANSEQQHYTNRIENSFVDNSGLLNIVARSEVFNDQGITKNYTSARLNSKFAFTYGRIDVRAKIPVNPGTWPAIWTLGKNINEDGGYWDTQGFGTTGWPACGEIDIMEHGIFPSESVNFINSALHTPCCNGGSPNGGGTYATDLENEFHVYSVNWSPNQMTFLLDGVGFYTYNPSVKNLNTWPYYADQYILLNIALGGIAGAIDSAVDATGVAMLIDYVRVYQADPLSLNENVISEVKVFPNPANSMLNITSKEKIDRLELYDIYGKLLINKLSNTSTLEVNSFNSGIYLLNIYSGSKKITKKVVIN